MVANAEWLRQVADKYDIQGVDRAVIDGCADKLESFPEKMSASIILASELHRRLVALNNEVHG